MRMTQQLHGKNAIVYGGGGGIGGAVAKAFAREGARVFLAGRTRDKLDKVAAEIKQAGGQADVAMVDAVDEKVVDTHAAEVVRVAGSIDISFNLISRGDVQQIPYVEMATGDLMRAVVTGLQSNFITSRAAARQMSKQGSGVILGLNSGSAKGTLPGMGSTGPADAATDAYLRYLAAEVGPKGVRVVGIYTAGGVETMVEERMDAVAPGKVDATAAKAAIAQWAMLRRAPTLKEVADTAVFLASDEASGITGTTVNVTCGLLPGPA